MSWKALIVLAVVALLLAVGLSLVINGEPTRTEGQLFTTQPDEVVSLTITLPDGRSATVTRRAKNDWVLESPAESAWPIQTSGPNKVLRLLAAMEIEMPQAPQIKEPITITAVDVQGQTHELFVSTKSIAGRITIRAADGAGAHGLTELNRLLAPQLGGQRVPTPLRWRTRQVLPSAIAPHTDKISLERDGEPPLHFSRADAANWQMSVKVDSSDVVVHASSDSVMQLIKTINGTRIARFHDRSTPSGFGQGVGLKITVLRETERGIQRAGTFITYPSTAGQPSTGAPSKSSPVSFDLEQDLTALVSTNPEHYLATIPSPVPASEVHRVEWSARGPELSFGKGSYWAERKLGQWQVETAERAEAVETQDDASLASYAKWLVELLCETPGTAAFTNNTTSIHSLGEIKLLTIDGDIINSYSYGLAEHADDVSFTISDGTVVWTYPGVLPPTAEQSEGLPFESANDSPAELIPEK